MKAGDALGPYELIEPLGEGGMGQVWLAQDTRLGRKVAVKVLPEQFAADPERLARFEQEARAAAALNHPHIAAVHDVGLAAGTHYMVQEHLQGETLRAAVERGALPLKRALALGAEIAAALTAAHRAGIVHRDLKPENVFVTGEGHAKVLDFGLAKLTEMGPAPSSGMSMSPTVLGTMAGTVMGTAGYMAPEQIEGTDVDRRADLFAFGCLLQEMVTGRRAFAGKSVLDTMHRIAHGEPEALGATAASSPVELQRVLGKCLTRDRDLRYQHADDLRVDLQRLIADVEAGRVTRPAAALQMSPATSRGVPVWALLAVTVAAVVAGALLRGAFLEASSSTGVVRFALRSEPGRPSAVSPAFPDIDISPAGDRIVYRVDSEDVDGELVSRSLGSLETTDIDCGINPAFSPDGQSLLCVKVLFEGTAQVALVRLSLGDGTTNVLIDRLEGLGGGGDFRGVGWVDDERVVIARREGLMLIGATGGPPTVLLAGVSDTSYTTPVGLPGGEAVLFSMSSADGQSSVGAVSIDTGEVTSLLNGVSHGRFVPPGHLVFVEGNDLRAVRFDAKRLQVRGEPVTVQRGVLVKRGVADYAVSASGTLVYRPDRPVAASRRLVWVDLDGTEEPLPMPARAYGRPRLSPDGRHVAVDDEGDGDIWVWDLQRQVSSRLTVDPGTDHSPLWDPSGEHVYFWSDRAPAGIYRRAAGGGGVDEFIATWPIMLRPYRFLPTGTSFLAASGDNHIYRVDIGTEPAVAPVLDESSLTSRPELSPDGRWLAYRGNETGSWQIYVRPYPDVESGRTIITAEGGVTPLWSRDGRTLYYMRDGAMFAVPIVAGERFDAGLPQQLFSGPYENFSVGGRRFDIAADGKRFLLVKDEASSNASSDEMVVVLDWATELQRLLPLQ